MSRSQKQYLLDIVEAIDDARHFAEDVTFEELEGDLRTQYAPPVIESGSSDGQAASGSGDTGSSSDEDDVVAEELYNGGDPGKQIEMDL